MPGQVLRGAVVRSVKLASAIAVLACALLIPASTQAGSGPSTPPVYVFPIPGSHLAMPQTQITFRGMPATQLGPIRVVGSASGIHSGVIRADSDGHGGSFLPAQPFRPGETVTVSTNLNVVGGTNGSYQFAIAVPAGGLPYRTLQMAPRGRGDVQRFHSEPGLIPAAVRVDKRGRTSRGYIFLAPHDGPVQNGPMVLDANGRLIWFKPLPKNQAATDVRVQRYQGRTVLSWWQGKIDTAGIGEGVGVIADSSYRPIAAVAAANGVRADLHEFQLTRANTALVTAFNPVIWNASGLQRGGPHSAVLDSVVQEIDVATGLVVFQWDSLDHVPLTDSHVAIPRNRRHPYDYFHVNSVQQDADGNLIVSSRNTWAAYKLRHNTGATIWTLGGRHSSFRLGPAAGFAFQHDVRAHHGDRSVTLFDDGGGPPRVEPASRGLTLRLNFRPRRATVVRQDRHNPAIVANFEGNDQVLPGGANFIGWGQQPYFSEFSAGGRLVFDAHFAGSNSSYRVYKFRWSGRPVAPPSIAASGGPRPSVYVSWNGATAIRRWRILAGRSQNSLRTATVAGIRGFETRIRIRRERFVEAQALDGKGRALGNSPVVRMR